MIIKRKHPINFPEQKEFNIISDIYHSGIKRAYKKHVGKARRNIADKMGGLIRDQYKKNYDSTRRVIKSEINTPENKNLGNKLKEYADNKNIKVYENNKYNNVMRPGVKEDLQRSTQSFFRIKNVF